MKLYAFNLGVPRFWWLPPKFVLIMKMIIIIMTTFLLQLSASGLAQRITYVKQGTTLDQVFQEIKKQTGFKVLYSNQMVNGSLRVNADFKNLDVKMVMDVLLKDQPLSYEIEDKLIMIRERNKGVLDRVAAIFAEDMELNGQVVNKKTNEPLSGVSIKIRNKRVGTGTNNKGEFKLSKLDRNAVITFSFVGFDSVQVRLSEIQEMENGESFSTKGVNIRKIAGSYFLTVALEPSVSYLDETIVQGYGKTDRRMATGNISKVTAEDIEKQPVMNPLLALQGRVPGMVVSPTSGYASGVVKVEIRGRSTINSKFTSDPLYIIDGVPLTYLEIGGFSSYEGGSTGVIQNGIPSVTGGQSPLYNINPGDIESIEVLKDADATAIYGSRGANGVILITTKKGKIGATSVTANVSQGVSKVSRYWDMLNTQQYLQMRREAFKNDGIVPTALNAPDLTVWDTTRYTNWQKELWGGTGQMTNASIGMSGGTENTQFRISGNYTRQTEILTTTGANKQAGLKFGLTNYSLNRKFKTDLGINYTYTDVNSVATPSAVLLPPNAPPIYNSDGGLNYQEWNDAGLPFSYPFGGLKSIQNSETYLTMVNLNLAYELLRGVEVSTSLGFNNSQNALGSVSTIASQNPVFDPVGSASNAVNNNRNWIVEPQVNYKTEIGKGKFTALLGATLQSTVSNSNYIFGYGYTDDNLLGAIGLAPITQIKDKSGKYKYAALFGRLNYSWEDKYIVNISGRRDGSSRFGPGKQYGNFGAVGVAWIVSQEAWIKSILPAFVSFVKLRGSYGITGSDGVGDYQYLTQWSSAIEGSAILSYNGVTPLVSLHAVNPDYRWQVNKKLEGGLSLSFLNDKINFEAAYYRNSCNNQLTDYDTPIFSGFPSVTANWPANIQNSGWEFSLSAKLITRKDFSWSLNMSGSVNKNILVDYPDIEHSPYALQYFIGKPLNAKYLLHYTGINPLNGQYSYEDYNHDGTITGTGDQKPGTGSDDRYITINMDPKFSGGLGNNFKYKNWGLSMFFEYRNQMGLNSSYGSIVGSMSNIPLEIYNNHWSQPGQQAKYALFTTRYLASNSNIGNSDLAYTDASYLRLNNVSLDYTLPEKLLKNKRINIYIRAQNVWTWTRYEGLDPTTQSFGTIPTAKVFVAGFSLTL